MQCNAVKTAYRTVSKEQIRKALRGHHDYTDICVKNVFIIIRLMTRYFETIVAGQSSGDYVHVVVVSLM